MDPKKLDLRLTETAIQKLNELRRQGERDGTVLCLSFIEQVVRSRGGELTSASEQWQVSLVDRSSVADIPAWYTVGEFSVFVPSFHLIETIVGKKLDYRTNGFVIGT
jgi:hypothetical protein